MEEETLKLRPDEYKLVVGKGWKTVEVEDISNRENKICEDPETAQSCHFWHFLRNRVHWCSPSNKATLLEFRQLELNRR